MNDEIHVTVHHEDDAYWAEVIEMPGCFATGDTLEEALQHLADAMKL